MCLYLGVHKMYDILYVDALLSSSLNILGLTARSSKLNPLDVGGAVYNIGSLGGSFCYFRCCCFHLLDLVGLSLDWKS